MYISYSIIINCIYVYCLYVYCLNTSLLPVDAFRIIPRLKSSQFTLYDKPSDKSLVGNVFTKIRNHFRSNDVRILDSINGFYGLIGPDVNISKTNNLFEFFTGDGIIQGVFIRDGVITPICHKIKTEKRMFEKEHNMRFSQNMMMMPVYMALHGMGIIPNILGLSNTAMLEIQSRVFTLFERDFPYEIQIDCQSQELRTIGKQYIPHLPHFSAHSKYDDRQRLIHSIDYNVAFKSVQYSILDNTFRHLFRMKFKCHYFPVIHDFGLYDGNCILVDSPLCFRPEKILSKKTPFVLNSKMNTYINVYNSRIDVLKTYVVENNGFYVFHYADINEDERTIQILAPLYDSLDFSSLDIEGKYRRIVIHKETGKVAIEKNDILESMNLDFPIKWNDKIILRSVNNRRIDGFVVCDGLEILHKMFYDDVSFCGEPRLVHSGNRDILISLGYKYGNMDDGYLFLIDVNHPHKLHHYKLNVPVNIGFHSIFLQK